jgi:hypothetical protein
VFVNKMMAARMGDMCAHGGSIVVGLPTVLIGETGGGGGGGGGMSAGAGVADNAYKGGGPAMVALAAAATQAKTLTSAGQDGTPFCEICFGKGGG